jgi:hypothetical protein
MRPWLRKNVFELAWLRKNGSVPFASITISALLSVLSTHSSDGDMETDRGTDGHTNGVDLDLDLALEVHTIIAASVGQVFSFTQLFQSVNVEITPPNPLTLTLFVCIPLNANVCTSLPKTIDGTRRAP